MTDVLQKSVTAADYADDPRGGVVYLQSFGWAGPDAWGLPPEPPRYWSPRRDAVLRSTLFAEDMWAGAVYKAITKNVALGWTVEDSEDSTRRVKQSQELFLQADGGAGWVAFGSRHLLDYLLSDNGTFVEIVRASSARGARILGICHLDSSRCRRTGDPDVPVIYTDLRGREHELRDYQVLLFADMPMSGASYFGVGMCAASRAYKTIRKLAAMERYTTEKISGSRATAIDIIRGVNAIQLQDAIATHSADRTAAGAVSYMGKILIPMMSNQDINVATIELAGVPDGFDAKQERDNAYVKYANALGVPVQDIQPLSGQGLGTGTQSVILDEAAQGQGLAAWRKQWEHLVNDRLLPAATTFNFATNDLRDKKAAAEVSKIRGEVRDTMITNGTISAEQARQMAADDGDIPREFLAEDQTAGGQLADDEKPIDPAAIVPWPTTTPATAPAAPAVPVPATKADDETPGPLRRLIARLSASIEGWTDALEAGRMDVDAWEAQMADALRAAYPAAYKAGGGVIDAAAGRLLAPQVKAQIAYLGRFALEIQGAEEWQAGWNARAQMYAEGIKVPYWQGATRMLPLPAMPGEGTTCLTRCKCSWDVQQLAGEGNYDAYWRRGATDSCQICIQRAADWAPLRVRDGRLV